MDLDRPLQVTADTPRHHAEAYLRLRTAEEDAAKAKGLVRRFENARSVRGSRNRDATVIVKVNERESKAVTMLYRAGTRGTGWEYIVTDVVG
jgi:hypothetical protein